MSQDLDNVPSSPRIVLCAGETSGDNLGARLIADIKQRYPSAELTGVCGPNMRAQGCETLADIEALSVMGIAEIARELPRLLKFRAELIEKIVAWQPDLVIGIDAPDFNLGLEKRLKARGMKVAHYVSPTVWAWRPKRIFTVQQCCDLVLCLFPFEVGIYQEIGMPAVFGGHPLAQEIPDTTDAADCLATLGLDATNRNQKRVALLPGSRKSEIKALLPVFLKTAAWLRQRLPNIEFMIPVAKPELKALVKSIQSEQPHSVPLHVFDGQAREVIGAADAVLVASGTAALETCLIKRPSVVSYKGSAITAWLLMQLGLLKVDHVCMPNILSGEEVVPEWLQENSRPELLGMSLYLLLTRPSLAQKQIDAFRRIHANLRATNNEDVMNALGNLIEGRPAC